MTPEIKVLQDLKLQHDRMKHPNFPPEYIAVTKYSDGKANSLTKCVIDWINLNGGLAERINSMGRMLDNRKMVTDVIGRQKLIGSTQYIPGTSRNGTADISATIRSLSGKVISWKIEIKIGKDRQSEDQRKYQSDIERAGGVYSIVKDFAGFMVWYKQLIEQ